MEDRARGIRGTRVELVLKDGTKFEETVLVPKGDPENPLTRADVIQKLKVCSIGIADEAMLANLVGGILRIDGAETFANPMWICRPC